jgi:hypothetical protein
MRVVMRAVMLGFLCLAGGMASAEQLVEGYASLLSMEGGATQITQFNYREEGETYISRATNGEQRITWQTAPTPKDLGEPVTFAFAVSLTGWEKVPLGEHELLLNGQRLVKLTIPVKGDTTWAEGAVTARFDYLRADIYNDLEGVIYLTVPAALLAPSEPAQLSVHSLASGSRSFFCLNAISDVLTDPAAHPERNPGDFVPPQVVEKPPLPDRVLFDFERPADPEHWTIRTVPEVRNPTGAKAELSQEHVTSGKRSLKITYAGGLWPALGTDLTPVEVDWSDYQSLKVDITVSRECVVAFRVLQEKSDPVGMGWEAGVSRWNAVAFLRPGKNAVQVALHDRDYAISPTLGKVTSFMVLLLKPQPGETAYVDNLRLSGEKVADAAPRFRVLGTDLEVSGVADLFDRAPNTSAQREPKTAAQVEAEFRAAHEAGKREHPRARLAIFRQGQSGYDPQRPEAIYTGWKDTHVNVHSPLGPNPDILVNRGAEETLEVFMRHRSQLIGIDVSSIPEGSRILAARFVMTVQDLSQSEWFPGWTLARPNMWVAEACQRPWAELEANGYEYAEGKLWRAMSGQYYGPDPDFLPLYVAHGPANGRQFPGGSPEPAVWWDFTEAVRFWTDGKYANHGFFFHGGGSDSPLYLVSYTCQAGEIEKRPALLVSYEAPGS